ncbi:MAG: hypothetical protein L0J57_13550 [Brachybacterium sp.]|uniref:CPBP family glutamic-type intramembrane protease n=1 Tax=Brachybacterium sp. TaxID=1891286 RepID=UPI0026562E94|nr:hypothetical protein [Brachybacterium sp.]MDN6330230.1 hypothetical protein [Brachybacterium sp.]
MSCLGLPMIALGPTTLLWVRMLAAFVSGIGVTALRSPQGVIVSADPGYAPTAVSLLLVPAGLGEEVLCRRLLPTRLEALAGPWTGILCASLLIGLHLPGMLG